MEINRVMVWVLVTQTAVLPPLTPTLGPDKTDPRTPSMRSGHQMQMLNLSLQFDPRARSPGVTPCCHS